MPAAQVEEQKRRAEADKLAAITALEQRSREFMREKEAKARLEARIASMQSQLLVGGAALEETPVFRYAIWGPRASCRVSRAVCRGGKDRGQKRSRLFADKPSPSGPYDSRR